MTPEEKLKMFVTDLRRALYLSKIYLYSLEWMKAGELCPSYLKQDISNIQNSINRMLNDMMARSTPEMWGKVFMEISKDDLHDLAGLIDCMYDVTNIAEITQVIESCKTQAA